MNATVAVPCRAKLVSKLSCSASSFIMALLLCLTTTYISKIECYGFPLSKASPSVFHRQHWLVRTHNPTHTSALLCSSSEKNVNDDDSSEESLMDQVLNRAETIQVELLRDQLEKANTQSFLKHAPWKLPYNDARLWIQANLGPNTKEEFYDLVENGNLRTPYIPKRPEEYYTRTREWISWDHFLTGLLDQEHPSAIQPPTGFFD